MSGQLILLATDSFTCDSFFVDMWGIKPVWIWASAPIYVHATTITDIFTLLQTSVRY